MPSTRTGVRRIVRVIHISVSALFGAALLSGFILPLLDDDYWTDWGRWAPSAVGWVAFTYVGTRTLGRGTRARLAEAREDPRQSLDHRITEVNRAFAEAASLMGDLQRDLASQQAVREALVAQAEEQQRLLEINQDQAENIRHILVGETKATIRAERRTQWMFFGLGLAASIPVGVAINLLVP
ncbi:hypothetical protein ACFV0L_18655 [Streptosporangium canum]|uniref:hypothetical protein n=1 Tax=Streptosporangium canum TaxID=324952 RepID=UPI0036B61EA9